MPIKRIQFPDGSIKRVEVPEGATDEQILSFVQSQHQPQETKQQKYNRIHAELTARNGVDGGDPTAGMSGAEKFMAGMGQSLHDTGRGIQQLYATVADKVAPRQRSMSDLVTGRDPSRLAAVTKEVARDRALDAPLLDTGAGLAGNIVGQGVQMAAPIPAGAAVKATSWAGRAAPFVGAATRAGVFGGMQGVGEGESRLTRAGQSAALGAAGQGIASATGKLAAGSIKRADPYTAALAQKAQQLGVKLGVANISENPLIRTVASQMERLPFSGAGKKFAGNQEAVNRAVGKAIGLPDAKRITPDVFSDAKSAVGDAFNTLSARNNLSLNTQHVTDVKAVIDEAGRLGGAELGASVRNWANDLFSRVDANGVIPGGAYKSFDSKIGKAMAAGGEKGFYLGQLREAVRNAMDSSISATDRAAWQLARKQWAAIKTVEPLVAKSANGNIPPSQLMGRVTADGAGKSRMAAGSGGELGDLARVAQRFLKDAPNSGTADRLLVNGAIGGGLYGAQQAGLIDPQTALIAGGGLLANRAMLGALNSRALTAGEGRAINGLARLLQESPRALPAAGPMLFPWDGSLTAQR